MTIYPHEATALHHYLHSRMDPAVAARVEERVRANAAAVGRMTDDEHRCSTLPCAFLEGNACSAYAVRPAACAGYHSPRREDCEHSFNNPTDTRFPLPQVDELADYSDAVHAGIDEAYLRKELDGERLELHTAVNALLKNNWNLP